MREAIGSSLLLNIVVVFVSLIILFFVGILSYTKAYKAKNRIIDVIEKYGTYSEVPETQDASDEIISSLNEMGYQLGTCKKPNITYKGKKVSNENNTGYKYCVYKIETSEGYYYKVTTYIQFYFPIIGELFNPPVSGETKILGKSYDY